MLRMALYAIFGALLLISSAVAEECIISPEEVQAWNSDLIVTTDGELTNGEYSVGFTFPGVTRAAFPQLWTCLLKGFTITLSVLDSQNNVIEDTETYQRFKTLQKESSMAFNVDNTRACKKFTFQLKLNGNAPEVARENFQPIRKEIVARPVSTPQLDFISGHTSIILNIRGNECEQHLKNIALYCKPGDSQSQFPLSLAGIEDTNTPQVSKRATFVNLVPNKEYICTSVTLQYSLDGTQFLDQFGINKKISTSAVQLEVEAIKSEYQGEIQVSLKTPNLSVKKFIKWKHEHETAFQQMEMTKNNYLLENLHNDELYNVCMEFSPLNTDLSCRSMCDSRQCQLIKTLPGKPARVTGLHTVQRHAHSLKLRWTALSRNQARGDFQYYVISAKGVLKRQVAGCTSSPTHKTQATVLRSQTETELLKLKPFHEYELIIWAKNDQYDGVKTNPMSVSTEEFINSPLTKRDVAWTVTSAELVTVTVKSKCIFAEKVYITAYLKEGSNLKENALYDRSKDRTEVTITSAFSPGRNYEACVKLCLPQGKCGGGTCDSIIIPEKPPSTPPRIKVNQWTIKHNEFTIELQDPKEDNGQIIKYNVVVQKHCAVQDKKCPPCTNFYTDGDLIVPRTGTITTHTFQSLKPGREYKITVNAENTAGKSPNATTLVNVTTSLPSNYVPDFSYSTGTNEITVNAKPICPYQGPVKYYVTYTQKIPPPSWSWKGSGSGTIAYDIDQDRSPSHTFNQLETGYKYEVCMEAELQACYSPQNCKSNKLNCKYITTKCNKVPSPSKDPVFVPWIDKSQWNPFTEIRVKLLKDTFNGSGGGISNYTIVCDHNIHSESFGSSQVQWNQDSYLTLSGLEPQSSYRVKVVAHGCKNTVETGYVDVHTRSIAYPGVSLETSNELYYKHCPQSYPIPENMKCEVIVITDSNLNIQYDAFTAYTIGRHHINNLFHEDNRHCPLEEKVPGEDKKRRVCPLLFPQDLAVYNVSSVSQYGPVFKASSAREIASSPLAKAAAGLSCVIIIALIVGLVIKRNDLMYMAQAWSYDQRARSDSPSTTVRLAPAPKKLPSKPLTKRELQNLVAKSNFTDLSKTEYQELARDDHNMIGLIKSKDAGTSMANRDLNRYDNIIPYDHSRVILQPGAETDYINASWVRGFQNRKFIAAQGPKNNTAAHFWQMIFENDVPGVIMLTKIKEKPKNKPAQEKCSKYWPNQGKTETYGEFKVRCLEDNTHQGLKDLTIRKFKITRGHTTKHTLHLHYKGWPDYGVPSSSESLLTLHEVKNQLLGSSEGPIVVHCSAGVGRTGTLIALDTLTREMEAEEQPDGGRVDVYGCLFKMRQDRAMLVQRHVQYEYLYKCVAAYIENMEQQAHRSSDPEYIYNSNDPEYIYFDQANRNSRNRESLV